MPSLETAAVEQRQQFIEDYHEGFYSMSKLCPLYGTSRKTGYKWLPRFTEGGRRRLADRNRATHTCPPSYQRRRDGASVPRLKEAPGLGTGQTARSARRPSSGHRMADDEYRGRLARPPWLGGQATAPPSAPTPGSRRAGDDGAQRSQDGGLQWAVHDARRHLLLSPLEC